MCVCVCVCVCERERERERENKIEACIFVRDLTRFFVGLDVRFDSVGFYGISTIVGYLLPNHFYTYILDIYDLVWLGFMAYQQL